MQTLFRSCIYFLDKLLYGNSYFLSDGVLAYVVKGPLRIFNFKYEPDIYTQEISQQICVYMKYLFTLLMACLSLSTTYGTVHHPSSSVSSGRWVVWAEKPATSWQDAFVTGNGRHGTMVMGQPGSERIICVHEELFIRGWDRHKVAGSFNSFASSGSAPVDRIREKRCSR